MANLPSLNTSTLPWYQEPAYIAASVRDPPPGVAPQYTVARWANPVLPGDTTSYVHGQRDWSETNLPAILYVLDPSASWTDVMNRHRQAPWKYDAQGRPVLGSTDAQLRDYPVLPDRIGSLEHPLIIEAWRRLDPRITWTDIAMRMYNPYSSGTNVINNRLSELRDRGHMVSWHTARSTQTAAKRNQIITMMIGTLGAATNSTAALPQGRLVYQRANREERFRQRHEAATAVPPTAPPPPPPRPLPPSPTPTSAQDPVAGQVATTLGTGSQLTERRRSRSPPQSSRPTTPARPSRREWWSSPDMMSPEAFGRLARDGGRAPRGLDVGTTGTRRDISLQFPGGRAHREQDEADEEEFFAVAVRARRRGGEDDGDDNAGPA